MSTGWRGPLSVGQPDDVTVLDGLLLPGEGVGLRRAVADDVPAIVGLLADDELGADRDGISGDKDLAVYVAAFQQIDADPAHLLLVATEGPQVVATMQLTFLPGLARRAALRAQVEAVRVRGDFRGRGLGAALLQWAIDEAGRRGCRLVQLSSDKSRDNAHRFYARFGFVATHEGYKLTLPS